MLQASPVLSVMLTIAFGFVKLALLNLATAAIILGL